MKTSFAVLFASSAISLGQLGDPAFVASLATQPAAFTPASISGLLIWLDVATLSLNDGDNVTTWNDSGPAGNNATAPAGKEPTYETNEIGSHPAVKFVRANADYMLANGVASTLSGSDKAFTLFVVARNTNSPNVKPIAGLGYSGSDTAFHMIYSATDEKYGSQRHDDAAGSVNVTSASTWGQTTHYATFVFTGTAISMRSDGAEVLASTAQDVGTMTVDRFAIGANAKATPTAWWWGMIAEFLVYDTALSAGDVTNMEAYLKAKYGL